MRIDVPLVIPNIQQASNQMAKFSIFAMEKEKQLQQLQKAGFTKQQVMTKAQVSNMQKAYASIYDYVIKNESKLDDVQKARFRTQLDSMRSAIKLQDDYNARLKQELEFDKKIADSKKQANITEKKPLISSKTISGGVKLAGVGLAAGAAYGKHLLDVGTEQRQQDIEDRSKLMLSAPDLYGKSTDEKKKTTQAFLDKARKAEREGNLQRGTLTSMAIDYTVAGGNLASFDLTGMAKLAAIDPEKAKAASKFAADYAAKNRNASKKEIRDVTFGTFAQSIAGNLPIEEMKYAAQTVSSMRSTTTTAAQKQLQAGAIMQAFNPQFGNASSTADAFKDLFTQLNKGKTIRSLVGGSQKDIEKFQGLSELGQLKTLRESAKGVKMENLDDWLKQKGITGEQEIRAAKAVITADEKIVESMMNAADGTKAYAQTSQIAADKLNDPMTKLKTAFATLEEEAGKKLADSFGKMLSNGDNLANLLKILGIAISGVTTVMEAILTLPKNVDEILAEFFPSYKSKKQREESEGTNDKEFQRWLADEKKLRPGKMELMSPADQYSEYIYEHQSSKPRGQRMTPGTSNQTPSWNMLGDVPQNFTPISPQQISTPQITVQQITVVGQPVK